MCKYYAVKVGRKSGIFNTWDECKEQVLGFKGAVYKSFTSLEEAKTFIHRGIEVITPKENNKPCYYDNYYSIDNDSCRAYIDGSYLDNVGYAFGSVFFTSDKEYHNLGYDNNLEILSLRNIAGELLSAIYSIELAINLCKRKIEIYYDYEGIYKWAVGDWKAKTDITKAYATLMSNYSNYIDIKFIKVKSHSGVVYNDLADKLAKKALKERIKVNSYSYLLGNKLLKGD